MKTNLFCTYGGLPFNTLPEAQAQLRAAEISGSGQEFYRG